MYDMGISAACSFLELSGLDLAQSWMYQLSILQWIIGTSAQFYDLIVLTEPQLMIGSCDHMMVFAPQTGTSSHVIIS